MQNRIRILLVSLPFTVASLPAAGAKAPSILDTDIGTDIDDAFALALIINSPDSDAQGFTRVVEGKSANATVALHTDPKRFFEFYLSRVAP
jgi:inosine-uridine nucleoside N-ribohydrolase